MSNQYTQKYGRDLCALVSSCLSVKPIDRPTLQQIRATLDRLRPPAVTRQDRDWLDRFLHLPRFPSSRPLANAFR